MLLRTFQSYYFTKTAIASSILALALSLVIFIGLGDAYRNYTNLINDKLNAQGQIIENSLETFLFAGLPLNQFSGFSGLTEPLLNTDPDIAKVSVIDRQHQQIIFESSNTSINSSSNIDAPFVTSSFQTEDHSYQIRENQDFYQIILPLKSKFDEVGELQLLMPKSALRRKVNFYFLIIGAIALFSWFVFAIIAFNFYKQESQRESNSKLIQIAYSSIYLVLASLVVLALTLLYSEGIQAKTHAITLSLKSRLNAAVELGLDLRDFEGINKTFEDYKRLNPEISYIDLKLNDQILFQTKEEPKLASSREHFEYRERLKPLKNKSLSLYALFVKSPKDILYGRLWRSVKNFLALFVASGFISIIFLNLLKSFTDIPENDTEEHEYFLLKRVEPFYFLGAFVDGLSLSFLPQYLENLATAVNADNHLVSTQFTVFFFGWALAMLPGANLVRKKGVKPILIWVGFLTILVSFLMAFVNNFYVMFAIRALAGVNQGLLAVGVQAYVLQVTSKEKKTQGSAMMVFDFFGGRLASTAIGALLSVYVGIKGVFLIGIFIALIVLWYGWKFIPQQSYQPNLSTINQPLSDEKFQQQQQQNRQNSRTFIKDILDVFKDWQFVKTLLFIGLPYRAVFTGVTVFALPLLLSQQQYLQEDIGQIMMFYAAGVLVASTFISRLVDRIGRADLILFLGCATSGIGLFLIGLMSWKQFDQSSFADLTTIIIIGGLTILGSGHGFINAPSLTYITQTQVASKIGQNNSGALYRLSERAGQIAGPILVGQLLFLNNNNAFTISLIGLAIIFLGVLFILPFNGRDRTN